MKRKRNAPGEVDSDDDDADEYLPDDQCVEEAIEADDEELDGLAGDDSNNGDDDDDPLATSDDEDIGGGKDVGQSRADLSDVEGDLSDSASSSDDSEPETQAEIDRKAAFFDFDVAPSQAHDSFLTMNLSRPILKAITTLSFHKPTPIQAATIPVALLGKDVVGGAVTGSGKTAAFTIPMLERLLYRERGTKAAATRCLVLVPTRELAVQCFDVGTKLATHTDIRFCLVVGV